MAAGAKDLQFMELKDTIIQLNNTVKEQNKMIASLQKIIEERSLSDAKKDQLISNLQEQLEYLKHKLFGSSSERKNLAFPGQLELFDQAEEKEPEIIDAELITPEAAPKKTRKPRPTLEEQFKNITTKQIQVDTLSDEEKLCRVCGTQMVPVGTEIIRTEIKYTRPKLEKIEYIATTYGCPECKQTEETQFVKDEGIPALIPHSYASESLVSQVLCDKFAYAIPFYRQETELKQLGAEITRNAMAHWAIYCAENYFEPVYNYLQRLLIQRRFLMLDETPTQVLKEPDRRPQSKSYIWLIRSGEDGLPSIILYKYTPTRSGENACKFLHGIENGFYFMADGYTGYNKLPGGRRCCCFAHIRRYLIEAIPRGHDKDYSNPAVQGALYCNKLFEYERTYKEKGLSYKQREKRRLKDEKPVLEAFLSWADSQKPVPGDRLDRAVKYIQNQRKYLFTYLEDGRCSLSNNSSENSVRPVTVGRKNWLFSDTQAGANASMIIYSMVEMAKAHNLKIYEYLYYLLSKRPSVSMTDEQLSELVPWNSKVQEEYQNITE